MADVQLVAGWLIEYACVHRMTKVIHAFNKTDPDGARVEGGTTIWTKLLAESKGAVRTRMMVFTIETIMQYDDIEQYETAVILIDHLFNAMESDIPFKIYLKCTTGLKILAVFHHLQSKSNRVIELLNLYFPAHQGKCHPHTPKSTASKMQVAEQRFRKFFLPLIADAKERRTYMSDADGYEEDFGEQFVTILKKHVRDLIGFVEKLLPMPVLINLIAHPDVLVRLSQKGSAAISTLVDGIDGHKELTEDTTQELLNKVLNPVISSSGSLRLSFDGSTSTEASHFDNANELVAEITSAGLNTLTQNATEEHDAVDATTITESSVDANNLEPQGEITSKEASVEQKLNVDSFETNSLKENTQEDKSDAQDISGVVALSKSDNEGLYVGDEAESSQIPESHQENEDTQMEVERVSDQNKTETVDKEKIIDNDKETYNDTSTDDAIANKPDDINASVESLVASVANNLVMDIIQDNNNVSDGQDMNGTGNNEYENASDNSSDNEILSPSPQPTQQKGIMTSFREQLSRSMLNSPKRLQHAKDRKPSSSDETSPTRTLRSETQSNSPAKRLRSAAKQGPNKNVIIRRSLPISSVKHIPRAVRALNLSLSDSLRGKRNRLINAKTNSPTQSPRLKKPIFSKTQAQSPANPKTGQTNKNKQTRSSERSPSNSDPKIVPSISCDVSNLDISDCDMHKEMHVSSVSETEDKTSKVQGNGDQLQDDLQIAVQEKGCESTVQPNKQRSSPRLSSGITNLPNGKPESPGGKHSNSKITMDSKATRSLSNVNNSHKNTPSLKSQRAVLLRTNKQCWTSPRKLPSSIVKRRGSFGIGICKRGSPRLKRISLGNESTTLPAKVVKKQLPIFTKTQPKITKTSQLEADKQNRTSPRRSSDIQAEHLSHVKSDASNLNISDCEKSGGKHTSSGSGSDIGTPKRSVNRKRVLEETPASNQEKIQQSTMEISTDIQRASPRSPSAVSSEANDSKIANHEDTVDEHGSTENEMDAEVTTNLSSRRQTPRVNSPKRVEQEVTKPLSSDETSPTRTLRSETRSNSPAKRLRSAAKQNPDKYKASPRTPPTSLRRQLSNQKNTKMNTPTPNSGYKKLVSSKIQSQSPAKDPSSTVKTNANRQNQSSPRTPEDIQAEQLSSVITVEVNNLNSSDCEKLMRIHTRSESMPELETPIRLGNRKRQLDKIPTSNQENVHQSPIQLSTNKLRSSPRRPSAANDSKISDHEDTEDKRCSTDNETVPQLTPKILHSYRQTPRMKNILQRTDPESTVRQLRNSPRNLPASLAKQSVKASLGKANQTNLRKSQGTPVKNVQLTAATSPDHSRASATKTTQFSLTNKMPPQLADDSSFEEGRNSSEYEIDHNDSITLGNMNTEQPNLRKNCPSPTKQLIPSDSQHVYAITRVVQSNPQLNLDIPKTKNTDVTPSNSAVGPTKPNSGSIKKSPKTKNLSSPRISRSNNKTLQKSPTKDKILDGSIQRNTSHDLIRSPAKSADQIALGRPIRNGDHQASHGNGNAFPSRSLRGKPLVSPTIPTILQTEVQSPRTRLSAGLDSFKVKIERVDNDGQFSSNCSFGSCVEENQLESTSWRTMVQPCSVELYLDMGLSKEDIEIFT